MRIARLVTLLALAALFSASGATARASSSGGSCSSYPTPREYRARWDPHTGRSGDRVRRLDRATAQRRQADASAARQAARGDRRRDVRNRLLAVTPSAALVYLVPAEHFLTFPLAPDRCLRPNERSTEHILRRRLRWEYTHHALCLLTVYAGHSTSMCSAAPGTVGPFLYGPVDHFVGLRPASRSCSASSQSGALVRSIVARPLPPPCSARHDPQLAASTSRNAAPDKLAVVRQLFMVVDGRTASCE